MLTSSVNFEKSSPVQQTTLSHTPWAFAFLLVEGTQYSSLRRPSREDSSDTLIVRVLIVLTSVFPFLASHYCT